MLRGDRSGRSLVEFVMATAEYASPDAYCHSLDQQMDGLGLLGARQRARYKRDRCEAGRTYTVQDFENELETEFEVQ